MGHLAKVVNGIVETVIVCDDIQWAEQNLGGTWVQTSYNTSGNEHSLGGEPLHKNYAGIGYTWDGIGFAAPQPFPSWILNSDTYLWEPPVPMPEDNTKMWQWNEDTQNWVELVPPAE